MKRKEARSLRILIIEDNKDLAMLLSSLFGLMGHKAVAIYSGLEGIKKAQEDRPDAIFCDIGLPDINGYEVAKQVRSIEPLKDVFLVALTGYAGDHEKEHALDSGFNRHVSKPVDSTTLKWILDNRE